MTTNNLRIGPSQHLGPLQVWPLIWEGMTVHDFKVPPLIDNLNFGEIDDGDGPIIDLIQVHNPTDDPFIIPSGWIISADLWQDRAVNSMEYVEPHSTIGISVSCVEKSRWSAKSNSVDGGRAPFSVIAAGWNYDSARGFWDLDKNSRQSRVWAQVTRQETRSGSRPTNSLRQVMEEDSISSAVQRTVVTGFKERILTYPNQNGVLVALDGQPLVCEFFSNPKCLKKTLRETLKAVSFDATASTSTTISSEEIRDFFLEIGNYKNYEIGSKNWGTLFAGGSPELDIKVSTNTNDEILHLSAINRNHRVLIGV